MRLSVVLAVRNEENNIGRCLKAVDHWADEIVVVDGSSTDKTTQIAKKYKAKVVITNNPPIFHINKQKAIDLAKGEWTLQLDADEVTTDELKSEIDQLIAGNPQENGFWIPRKNFFLGKFLTKGGVYPDYTMRLYKRGTGRLPCKSVHEQAIVSGKVGYLRRPMLHYADPNFSRYLERFNRYTDLWAKDVTGGILSNLIIKPLFDKNQGFLSIYFRHLGFLDGFQGFIWALFSSLNFPVAYFKSLELKNNHSTTPQS